MGSYMYRCSPTQRLRGRGLSSCLPFLLLYACQVCPAQSPSVLPQSSSRRENREPSEGSQARSGARSQQNRIELKTNTGNITNAALTNGHTTYVVDVRTNHGHRARSSTLLKARADGDDIKTPSSNLTRRGRKLLHHRRCHTVHNLLLCVSLVAAMALSRQAALEHALPTHESHLLSMEVDPWDGPYYFGPDINKITPTGDILENGLLCSHFSSPCPYARIVYIFT
jgi:hypothetical protein